MKQAYQHLNDGTTYYQHISETIKKCVDTWNSTHNTKADIKVIAGIFRTIFKYHHWIKVDDIEPSIELGLMGEFGENKGLNTETIFNWFKGYSKYQKSNELKTHSAYKTENTYISMEQRKETRLSLIQTFMNFYDEYSRTRTYNGEMRHYILIFYKWFKKLGYISISEDVENKIIENECKSLRSLRSILSGLDSGDKSSKTIKDIFMDAFILAIDNQYPIEDQLKSMEL